MLEIVSLSLEQKERILCGDGNDGDADGKGDADSDKKMMSLLLDHFEDLSFLSLSFDVFFLINKKFIKIKRKESKYKYTGSGPEMN